MRILASTHGLENSPTIQTAISTIESNVMWMTLNSDTISNWLTEQ